MICKRCGLIIDKEDKQYDRCYHKLCYREHENERASKVRKHKKVLLKEFLKDNIKCGRCNKTSKWGMSFFEWHHIDPSIKEYTISELMKSNYSWEKVKKEIDKCILLCPDCHKLIHLETWGHPSRIDLGNKNG